jgi:hypothetical protein
MPNDEQPTIELPRFPLLTWNDFYWDGAVHLPAWRGFIPIQELCPWVTSGIRPDGELHLHVSSPVDERPEPPSREQIISFQHLLDNQASLREAALQAIFADYPRLRECYGDFVDDESMPRISAASDLLRLIRPGGVHLLAHPKDGFTRVGFGFSCKWDEEHGLGVLTHRGVVIAVGGADEAFSEYFPDLERERE